MPSRESAVRAARIAAAAASIASSLLFLWVALRRVGYPFELEWLEGAMADHMMRVIRGEQLYVAPGVGFVPFIYPPLFYYLSAAVALVTGPGLLPMRLVALGSTVGCFVMIAWIVRRESRSALAAIVAAGVFAATFVPGGAWFDLARVDSLFILFMLVAAALVRFGNGVASSIAAGVVLWLGLMTKQSAIIIGAPLLAYLALYDRRRALWLAVAFTAPAVASHIAIDAASDGWYSWYAWKAPAVHGYILQGLYTFWAWSVLRALPIASIASLWYFLSSRRRQNPSLVFHALFGAGMIGASWLHRLHRGGYENVLLLAFAALAILAGLGMARLLDDASGSRRATLAICAATVIQLVMLTYNPAKLVPGAEQRRAWSALVDRIRRVDGPVWIPYHGYIAELAGKPSGVHLEATMAVMMTGENAVSDSMRASLVGALEHRVHRMIVADQSLEATCREAGWTWLLDALHRNYVVADTVRATDEELMPMTGARARPQLLYVPRP
jgi:hypothetical protein